MYSEYNILILNFSIYRLLMPDQYVKSIFIPNLFPYFKRKIVWHILLRKRQ